MLRPPRTETHTEIGTFFAGPNGENADFAVPDRLTLSEYTPDARAMILLLLGVAVVNETAAV